MRDHRGLVLFCAALAACAGCSDACDEPQLAALHPLAAVSHDRIDFGEVYVGATRRRQVAVRSAGSADLALRAVRLDGDPAFALEGALTAVLAPGSAHEVTIRFAPTAVAELAATLAFETDAEQAPVVEVLILGRGQIPPSCDDDNPCTEDRFDLAAERCAHVERSGTCDDRSACTVDDRCVDGACLGQGLWCDDGNPCTLDLCDPASGCIYPVDTTLCDDGDPCTADTCDPVQGICVRERAPNGTPCGPIHGCDRLPLCQQGVCVELPVPDGTPCNDGDLCTLADRCQAGVCAGARSQRPPEVVGSLSSYGTYASRATVLDSGQVLFAEPHGYQSGWGFVAASGVTVHAVEEQWQQAQGEAFSAVGHVELASQGVSAIHGLGAEAAALVEPGAWRLHFMGTAPGAAPVTRGALALPADMVSDSSLRLAARPYQAISARRYHLYAASLNSSFLHVIDATDLDNPRIAASVDLGHGIQDLALDDWRQRLFVVTAGHALEVYSLADPEAPALLPLSAGDRTYERVVTNGLKVVLAAHTPDLSVELEIRDADDLAWLNTIDFYTTTYLNDLVLSAFEELVCLVSQEGEQSLYAYLIDYPFASFDHGRFGLRPAMGSGVGPQLALASHTLVVQGGEEITETGIAHHSARIFTVETIAPDELGLSEESGPGHGSLHTLVARPTGIYALAPDSAHRIELSQDSVGYWASGAVLGSSGSIFRISGAGAGSSFVVSPGMGAQHWMSTSFPGTAWTGLWLDVEDPARAEPIGSLFFEQNALLVGDGRFVFGTSRAESATAAGPLLHVLDLRALEPDFDLRARFDLTVVLDQLSEQLSPTALWLDAANATVAVAATSLADGSGPREAAFVVDVSAPLALRVLAADAIAGRSTAIASDGRRVVALEVDPDASWGGYNAHTLRVYDLLAAGDSVASLAERSALPLTDANHFLAFDGQTAFVSTKTGVAIVDASAQQARLLAALPTPQAPISAAFVNDHLYLASPSAVTVVHPPCSP